MTKNTSLKIVFKLITALTVVSALLAGCSSNPKKEEQYSECFFPETEKEAPGWVCEQPVPGIDVQALGIAEKSVAGLSYMKDQAALDARGRLAEQTQVQVQKMVKQYLGTTGRGDRETLDAAAESVSKSITNETLYGSKVYKSITGPNGRLYVVVGIDSENIAKIAETSAKTSMNNEEALWQQFKAKQSHEEMAREIAKQNVQ